MGNLGQVRLWPFSAGQLRCRDGQLECNSAEIPARLSVLREQETEGRPELYKPSRLVKLR